MTVAISGGGKPSRNYLAPTLMTFGALATLIGVGIGVKQVRQLVFNRNVGQFRSIIEKAMSPAVRWTITGVGSAVLLAGVVDCIFRRTSTAAAAPTASPTVEDTPEKPRAVAAAPKASPTAEVVEGKPREFFSPKVLEKVEQGTPIHEQLKQESPPPATRKDDGFLGLGVGPSVTGMFGALSPVPNFTLDPNLLG